MPIFDLPSRLVEMAHFTLPAVRTWGHADDGRYKEQVRQAAGLRLGTDEDCAWFVFCIRCVVGESRGRMPHQIPDVENVPKLIVDAFSGVLYPVSTCTTCAACRSRASGGRRINPPARPVGEFAVAPSG